MLFGCFVLVLLFVVGSCVGDVDFILLHLGYGVFCCFGCLGWLGGSIVWLVIWMSLRVLRVV